MRGALPDGPVLVFDDDAFYIGSLMTEVLRAAGREVIYVTPDDVIGSWTAYTQEYRHVQRRLRTLDVRIITAHNLLAVEAEAARLGCVYSGREQSVSFASILAITARLPNDELQSSLESREHEWLDAGVESVTAIGDCLAPGLIVHAVYSGHRYAQELDASPAGEVPFARRASQPRMP
jgi:dimethylamine/trimethylamine dehydrogenase